MKKKKIRRNKTDKDGYEYNFDGVDARYLRPAKLPDWFPSPAEISKMLHTAKITITMEDGTVHYFKEQAKKNNVSYQRMMREVLKNYVRHHTRHRAA